MKALAPRRIGAALRDRVLDSEWLHRMLAGYQALSQRDQRALLMLAAAVGLAGVIFGLLGPLQQQAEQARMRYRQALDDLAWMQAHRHEVVPHREKAGASTGLLGRITESAARHGLSVRHLEPIGESGMGLEMTGEDFDRVIPWLVELMQADVHVEELRVNRSAVPGTADLKIVLRGR